MKYESFVLDNGLKVYVHEDHSVRTTVLNLLYNVGSKDEHPDKTGFAHLFEHLMFGGSINIPEFDTPLQKVGGENNAFTTPDYTNYYITLPSENIETAFWLESDRMLSISFDPEVLEVQRKVVIEEFKQRYLNQPYGDVWLKLRPLAYQKHPYRWPTIGKEIAHIVDATMRDVKHFFNQYYVPNNAILVLAGDITLDKARALSEKWFGPIPMGEPRRRNLPQEPEQDSARKIELLGNVPSNAIYKVYHMPERLSVDYHSADLLSDILGRSNSSRLYQSLVKKEKLMSKISAYVTASHDPGLLIISGRLSDGVSFEDVDGLIEKELDQVIASGVEKAELQKVQAQAESSFLFGEIEVLNRAIHLAHFANLGNAALINEELNAIRAVSPDNIQHMAKKMLSNTNCSTLYYQKS